jgi:hypothetical protein
MKKKNRILKRVKADIFNLSIFLKIFFKNIPVFDPTSSWKIIWDFIILFIILFITYMIPLHFCFVQNYKEEGFPADLSIINPFSYFLFLDLAISLNTGVYDKGYLVKERIIIAKKFFSQKIFTEICGSLVVAIH